MKPDVDKARKDVFEVVTKLTFNEKLDKELYDLGKFIGEVDSLLSQLQYTADGHPIFIGSDLWEDFVGAYKPFTVYSICDGACEDIGYNVRRTESLYYRHPETNLTVQETENAK